MIHIDLVVIVTALVSFLTSIISLISTIIEKKNKCKDCEFKHFYDKKHCKRKKY